MNPRTLHIQLSPKRTAFFLLYVFLLLLAIQIFILVMQYGFGHGRLLGFSRLFHFDVEQNVPTLFNTLLFLVNSLLFFLIWRSNVVMKSGQNKWIWLLFSIIFIFLAIDEFCEVHEQFSEPVHNAFDTHGFFYFAWVIPYGIGTILLLAFFIPVWWKMDKISRASSAISAILFITGALLLEMCCGRKFESLDNQVNLSTCIFSTIEETFEMCSLILLIYALMRHLVVQSGTLTITVQLLSKGPQRSPNE